MSSACIITDPPTLAKQDSQQNGGSLATAADMPARRVTQDNITGDCRNTTLQHFLNQLPIHQSKNKKVEVVQVLRPEMLLLKYSVVVEKRRNALKLSASAADPKTILYTGRVNEIMEVWREEFLATDRTQWSLARDKDRLGEE